MKTTKKFSGHLKETSFRSQATDAFPRLQKEVGHAISSDGVKCWTNIKAYAQEPNMKHGFTIKLGVYNPEGKAFVQMPVNEFDDLLADLILWREQNNKAIEECLRKDLILKSNKKRLEQLETILSNTEYSEPPQIVIDGENITERSITREKELIKKMLEVLPNSSHKATLIKDICSRIDDLIKQSIDVSDLDSYMQELTKELVKGREGAYSDLAEEDLLTLTTIL